MTEQKTIPVELGAEMNYSEHEKTYLIFIAITKYGTLTCIALLLAMMVGFYTSGGFLAGIISFIIFFLAGRKIINLVV